MLRQKKQLLGMMGLAFVGALTAVACAIPAPEASAYEHGVGLTVSVAAPGNIPEAKFTELTDQETVVRRQFSTTISYIRSEKVDVYLRKVGEPEPGIKLTGTCDNVTYSEEMQTCTVDYDLGDVSSDGTEYITNLTATGRNDAKNYDSVQFIYRAARIEYNDKVDQNSGNPIVDVSLNDKVKKVLLQAYDKNNNPLFVKDGKEVPFELNYDDIQAGNGEYAITLPFKDYNAKAGDYRVVLFAYETEGPTDDSLISIDDATVKYVPKSDPGPGPGPNPGPNPNPNPDPEVPDTGSNLFKDLNISNADYIVTGLLAFGFVTAFAIFLIVRRNKR